MAVSAGLEVMEQDRLISVKGEKTHEAFEAHFEGIGRKTGAVVGYPQLDRFDSNDRDAAGDDYYRFDE